MNVKKRIPPIFWYFLQPFTTSKCFPLNYGPMQRKGSSATFLIKPCISIVLRLTIGWRIMFWPQSGPTVTKRPPGANAFQFLCGWCWSERSLSCLQPDMTDAYWWCLYCRDLVYMYICCSVVVHCLCWTWPHAHINLPFLFCIWGREGVKVVLRQHHFCKVTQVPLPLAVISKSAPIIGLYSFCVKTYKN